MEPPARRIDLDRWARRDHFRFFRAYEEPFWSLCAKVDVTELLDRRSRERPPSFFLAVLHATLRTVNGIEELKTRIRGRDVVVHEVIHGGSTVLRSDQSFGFAYFAYDPDFERFAAGAAPILEHARTASGALDPQEERDDLIHTSVIPWVSFTSFTHARRRSGEGSVPRFVFGRHQIAGDRRRMPVSVEVHHALADGLHVGRFFEAFQRHLDEFPG